MKFGKNVYINHERILGERNEITLKHVLEDEDENEEEVRGFLCLFLGVLFSFGS